MAKRIIGTTPKQDGYRMPGEFEEQECIWMLWPWRNDNWRQGAKPAQTAFANVAKAIPAQCYRKNSIHFNIFRDDRIVNRRKTAYFDQSCNRNA